jgi:hypothetical protein
MLEFAKLSVEKRAPYFVEVANRRRRSMTSCDSCDKSKPLSTEDSASAKAGGVRGGRFIHSAYPIRLSF